LRVIFTVHHGRIFSKVPPPAYVATPTATLPSTPTKSGINLPSREPSPPLERQQNEKAIARPVEQEDAKIIHPLLCLGFKIQEQIAYISDVSHIPDHVWDVLRSNRRGAYGPLPALILDCLRLRPHPSHLGIVDSIRIARRIGATKTYLTGFSHDVAHEEYVTITEGIGGLMKDDRALTESERNGIELVQGGQQLWVRPAHDGLRLFVSEDGNVRDETY
jgi:phosphoribosyl 1,2-cyclic phosphodiesterase